MLPAGAAGARLRRILAPPTASISAPMQPTEPASSAAPPRHDAADLTIAIVASRYHRAIVDRLAAGAEEAFLAAGGGRERLILVESPGAFELVPIASALARRSEIDAVVTLGCIVRGETRHDRVLADAIAAALANLSAELAKPVAFGVLTVKRLAEAEARSGGASRGGKGARAGNKGREAMVAAVAAALAIRNLKIAAPSVRGGGS